MYLFVIRGNALTAFDTLLDNTDKHSVSTNEICAVCAACIWVLVDIEHVKVTLGSFGTLLIKLGSNSKAAHCRVKPAKILFSGLYIACIFFTLNMSKSFEVIWWTFPKKSRNLKRLIIERN